MGKIGAQLERLTAKHYDAYHTPGHKGLCDVRDVTELGRGGALFPAGAVQAAERDAARLYGVPYMRFLTGGSSMGIKAALWCFRGKKVLYAPGAHRAFFEGCALCGVHAEPIVRAGEACGGEEYTAGCDFLPAPLSVAEAERALRQHADASALFITSPDVLGRTAEKEIADVCRHSGVALLADAAHGAHFAFAPGLQAYAFEGVADFCNLSAHKTLNAYTQSALLAVTNERYFADTDTALRLLGTTSPNYVLFARLEDAVREAAANGAAYERLAKLSERLRKSGRVTVHTDYTRLCVRGGAAEFERLVQRGVLPETVIGDDVVLIITLADDAAKTERLETILTEKAI